MKLYKYWTSAESPTSEAEHAVKIRCFGYSNNSLEEALENARERANRVASQWSQGDLKDSRDYYDRAVREEIVEEFQEAGDMIGIISRNAYGALVLNSAVALFADVDIPQQVPGGCLFFGMGGGQPSEVAFETQLLERIETIVSEDRSLQIRLYRTKAGYRTLVQSRTIPPGSAESERLFEKLGSDSLYRELCRQQQCFRARLTPKPWRMGLDRPPARYPYRDQSAEQAFGRWHADYESRSEQYATCAVIGEFGDAGVDPVVDKLTRLHDHYVLGDDKPLA